MFDDCSLLQALFDYPKCRTSNFTRVSLVSANSSQNFLDGALLRNVNAVDGIFHVNQRGFIHRLVFSNSKLSRANFEGGYLPFSRFNGCELFAVNFRQSDVSDSDFSYRNLEEADFANANMKGVLLNRSSLAFATLSGARLTEARFPLSDLSYANLTEASCADDMNRIGKTDVISNSTENVNLCVTLYSDSSSPSWLSYLEVIVVPYLQSL